MKKINGRIALDETCQAERFAPTRMREFRTAVWVLRALVTLVILLGNLHFAAAQYINDDGTAVTCTGDWSDGIGLSSPDSSPILNVLNLTTHIQPAAGVDGVEFLGSDGQSLTLDFLGLGLTPGDEWSILASGDEVRGIDVWTEANNGAGGTSSHLSGLPGGAGGSLTVDSTGDILTTGNDTECVSVQSFAGDGGNGIKPSFGSGGTGAAGGLGGDIVVDGSGFFHATGVDDSHGMFALTYAGNGGNGANGGAFGKGGAGGAGGDGGHVTLANSGEIKTAGYKSAGVWGYSLAGRGGDGGEEKPGGPGGNAGAVLINAVGTISTLGESSPGVAAYNFAGGGGTGGSGLNYGDGGAGGLGGRGGDITITGSGDITTGGTSAEGMLIWSDGGHGGFGGDGGSIEGAGGRGGEGGAGGWVRVGHTQGDPNSILGDWSITTLGSSSHAIRTMSKGGGGGNGRDQNAAGDGGDGGSVGVHTTGVLTTQGEASAGILAWSYGGNGGEGGDGAGISGPGSKGGDGGNAGFVEVRGNSSIDTLLDDSIGIVAISEAGSGGIGGKGVVAGVGGDGGFGGIGGTVSVNGAWSIETRGNRSHGIAATNQGGAGGRAGSGGWIAGGGGTGGDSGHGGPVAVIFGSSSDSGGSIDTRGEQAHGIFAQTIGGLAGAGASGSSIFSASGGNGGSAGNGGSVDVNNLGRITTLGIKADAIQAQSVGGGGGSAGRGSGLFTGGGGNSKAGGDGGTVSVLNQGALQAAGRAIFAQSVGGSGGNAAAQTGLWASIGATGGTGGDGTTVTVENRGGLTTSSDDAHGIFAQSVGGGGGYGGNVRGAGLFGSVTIGGAGGGGGDGGRVYVLNDGGSIETGEVGVSDADGHGIFAQSVGGGGGSGGYSASFSAAPLVGNVALAIGGSGGDGGRGDLVEVDSSGQITTHGTEAYGIYAQSLGGGGGEGGFSVAGSGTLGGKSISIGIGGAGGTGDDGGQVTVGLDAPVSGTIGTEGDRSHGILAQSIGGGGGNGAFSVGGSLSNGSATALSLGGGGGDGGFGAQVVVDSEANVVTHGHSAHGVFAQSEGGGGGTGGFSVTGALSADALNFSLGGEGGSGGKAGDVDVTSSGTVATLGEGSCGVLAQSNGGGGGRGNFSVGASISATSVDISMGGQGGDGGTSGDVSLLNEGNVLTSGSDAYGLYAQSLAGGGGAAGFSVAGGISGATTINVTLGGIGGTGNDAGNVALQSTGDSIATSGAGAHAIVGESTGGGGGSGGFSVAAGIAQGTLGVSIGGTGGAAGNAGTVNLKSTSSITTTGEQACGLFADSLGGGGGRGGFTVAGGLSVPGSLNKMGAVNISFGGSGGGGGDGGDVIVSSEGAAITTGAELPTGERTGYRSSGIAAGSTGGGGGNAGFSVAAGIGQGTSVNVSLGGRGGAAGNAGGVDVTSSSNITTFGLEAPGIQANSQGGGGGNGGFSVAGGASMDTSVNVSVGGMGDAGGEGGPVNAGLTEDPISGTIRTYGDRSVGIQASSRGGGGGNGGFSVAGGLSVEGPAAINVSVGGFGASGGDAEDVHVVSAGTIVTEGEKAHGIQAQSLGGGGGNGGFSVAGGFSPKVGVNLSVGGFGAKAGVGKRVEVDNSGQITTRSGTAHAIQAQSTGGGGGNGGFSVAGNLDFKPGSTSKAVNVSIGGFGGAGNYGGAVVVDNDGALTTSGENSDGISAQSTGGGGGEGGFSATGALTFSGDTGESTTVSFNTSLGGFGGSGNVGGPVEVVNRGRIKTGAAGSHAIAAASLGGGGGKGGMSNALAVGLGGESKDRTINLAAAVGGFGGDGNQGGAVEVDNEGLLQTDGIGAHGIFAQSVGGGGGDAGDAASHAMVLGKRVESPTKKNNYTVAASVGGFGGDGSHGSAVDVVNGGNIQTEQEGSHGIVAQSIGAGGGNGGNGIRGVGGTVGRLAAGLPAIGWNAADLLHLRVWNVNVGGDAGASGDGGTVRVVNHAAISTNGSVMGLDEEGEVVEIGQEGSYGILAQSIGGGGGTSLHTPRGGTADVGLIGLIGLGGTGGAAGQGGAVSVFNGYDLDDQDEPTPSSGPMETIETNGDGAHAILAQSVGGGGGIAGDANGGVPIVPEAISWGLNELFGRDGGSSGDGGATTVRSRGDIVTHGAEAIGILAQSIGGGGGIGGNILAVEDPVLNKTLFEIGKHYGSVGGDGSGGTVLVDHVGDITTEGARAHGIFAQSAGGVADSVAQTTLETDDEGNPVLDANGKPTQIPLLDDQGQPVLIPDRGDLGSPVQVNVRGNVTTPGVGAYGIFAQSMGDDGNGAVSVNVEQGTIQGGLEGHAVRIMGGLDNTLNNSGNLTTTDGKDGIAVLADVGNDTINNQGVIEGSIDLGAGTNAFHNHLGAFFAPGQKVDLGAGNTLTNHGILSPGNSVMTTEIVGNLVQSESGVLEIEVGGFAAGLSDLLSISGAISMAGHINFSLISGYNMAAEIGPKESMMFEFLHGDDSLNIAPTTSFSLSGGPIGFEFFVLRQNAGIYLLAVNTIPEPSAITLFGIAAGLGAIGRRVRKPYRAAAQN